VAKNVGDRHRPSKVRSEVHSRPKLRAFSSPPPRRSFFIFTTPLGYLRRSGVNNPQEGVLSVGEFAAAGGDDGGMRRTFPNRAAWTRLTP